MESIKDDYERKNPGSSFSDEFYVKQFIQAEFPQDPDQDKLPHNIQAANFNKWYANFIATTMYHTCKVGRCKEKATDPCSKHFPVQNILNCNTLLYFFI
jgi:hypothetical protein